MTTNTAACTTPQGISRREALRRVGFMLGGALAAPTVSGVLSGCRADSTPDWRPQVFSTEQNELVATISERILPETDTPGARAAHVNRFIDRMLAEWYPAEEKDRFLRALPSVDRHAQETHSKPFMALAAEEQTALLTRMDAALYAPSPSPSDREASANDEVSTTPDRDTSDTPQPDEDKPTEEVVAQGQSGEPMEETEEPLKDDTTQAPADELITEADEAAFFRRMKELTLLGYYTSEIGATQELRHQTAFGAYQGCIPYGPDDRTWA